jgi:hypothetical protein
MGHPAYTPLFGEMGPAHLQSQSQQGVAGFERSARPPPSRWGGATHTPICYLGEWGMEPVPVQCPMANNRTAPRIRRTAHITTAHPTATAAVAGNDTPTSLRASRRCALYVQRAAGSAGGLPVARSRSPLVLDGLGGRGRCRRRRLGLRHRISRASRLSRNLLVNEFGGDATTNGLEVPCLSHCPLISCALMCM